MNLFANKILLVLSLIFLPKWGLGQEKWLMPSGNITHKYVLDNGLEVFITQNQRAPLVSLYHWVRAGSLHETKGTTGIAHLFEHMMFRPVSKENENFFDKIKPLGATANANTRYMSTVYTTDFPAENLERILAIEADRFQNLKVTDELLDIERQAVWSEYSTKFDTSPVIDIWGKIYEVAFVGHPYEWTIIGYREDLNKIKAEHANHFYKKFYVPNNVGIFISGNVNIKQSLAWVKKYYGSWQVGEPSVLPQDYNKPTKLVVASGRVKSPARQILAGFRLKEENKYSLEYQLLNHILFSSGNSLAQRRLLVDKKLVSSISDFNFDYDSGMMKVFMTALSNNWQSILQELLKLSSDFKSLSEEDFAAFKREFLIGFQEGILRNTQNNMSITLFWGKYSNVDLFFNFPDRLNSINKNDLDKLIQKFYLQDNLVFVRAKN